MKRYILNVATLVALMATAVACDKNDEGSAQLPQMEVNGKAISVALAPTTRAIENDIEDLKADGFYLYIDQDGDYATTTGEGDTFAYMKFDDEAQTWSAYTSSDADAETLDLKWTNFKAARVTALYAKGATIGSSDLLNYTISVPSDQSGDEDLSPLDQLIASTTRGESVAMNEETGKITVAFEHLLSRVAIKVMKDGSSATSVNSVLLKSVAYSATANLAESTTELIMASGQGITMHFDPYTNTYEAMVLPQKFSEGMDISINTYDAVMVFTTISDFDGGNDVVGGFVSGGDYEVAVPVSSSFFPIHD